MSTQHYRLVVAGELGPRYAAAFDGMTIFAHDGVTEIEGPIVDPSHLQGLLERIASLGLNLRSVVPLDVANGEAVHTTSNEPNRTNHDQTHDPQSSR